MTIKEQIQKALERFTPEQQQLAKSIATMRLENRTLQQNLSQLQAAYDSLWQVIIVLLCVDADHEIRIHESQFKRFKEEYRIDKWFDEKTRELVMRRKTLMDE